MRIIQAYRKTFFSKVFALNIIVLLIYNKMTSVIISQQVDYPLKTLFIGTCIYKYVTVKLPANVLSKRLKLLFVESHMFDFVILGLLRDHTM